VRVTTRFAALRGLSRDLRWFLVYNSLYSIGIGVFFVLFNLYLVRLGLREDFIGTFQSLATLAQAVGAVVVGNAINRLGALRCMRWGMVAFGATSCPCALVTSPPLLLGLGVLNGLATALLTVPNMPFAMDRATDENRTKVASVSFSIASLSSTLGTLLGGALPAAWLLLPAIGGDALTAYRATLLTGVALTALAWLPLALVRDEVGSPRVAPLLTASGRAEARVARNDVAAVVAAGALLALGTGSILPFFNVYLAEQGMGAGVVGVAFAISGLVASLSALAAPALAARFGHLAALRVLRLISIPITLPLVFLPSAALGVGAYAARNISFSMAWAVESAFVTSIVPRTARALALSYRSAAWNLGYALASFVAGVLIVRHGYGLAFLSYCVFSAGSAAVFQVYFRRRARQRSSAAVAPAAATPPGARG
jgi:MFS family permease